MSLTNHQLRSFARHIESFGHVNNMSSVMQGAAFRYGLTYSDGTPTPTGRDALATVPHLIDPEPPPPKTPDTRECSACDGQGARYVSHVFEVRDSEAGKMTQHTRATLVVCDAPGCERGRVTVRPCGTYDPRKVTVYQSFGLSAVSTNDVAVFTTAGVRAAIRHGLDYNGAPLKCAPGEIVYSIPAATEIHKRQASERTPPKTKPALVHVTKEDTQRASDSAPFSWFEIELARRQGSGQ